MNNITASLKKKIYLFLTLLIIGSIVIFSFGAEIDDWRRHLFSIGADSWQSASQIEIEIVREGVVVDSITSTLTNSLNSNGFPDDLVTVPPTINALVGDTIRITDLSAPTPGAWDFQKYYNGSPYFTQQFFYGNSPFPYEETVVYLVRKQFPHL